MSKMLSILTNFGCHYTCPYCVVKNTGISIPETTTESLDYLLETYENGGYDGISVSGGGDPMHEYEKHTDYYDKLFSICSENHIPLELHTSYVRSELPYSQFELVAFHLNKIDDIWKADAVRLTHQRLLLSPCYAKASITRLSRLIMLYWTVSEKQQRQCS